MNNDTSLNHNIYQVYTEKTLSKIIRKVSTEKKIPFPPHEQSKEPITYEAKEGSPPSSLPNYLSPRGDHQ